MVKPNSHPGGNPYIARQKRLAQALPPAKLDDRRIKPGPYTGISHGVKISPERASRDRLICSRLTRP